MDIRRLQLSTSRYSITIYQSGLHVAIDVRPANAGNILGGYITALKRLDVQSQQVLPAEVVFSVSFARRLPGQVEPLCDWMLVTADLAGQLDLLFTERDDFGMSITVKEHGVSLVVGEAERVEAANV